MNLDRSLAFTALLEHDPDFAGLDMNAGGERITEFLADWTKAGKPQMFEYSKQWVSDRRAERSTSEIDRPTREGLDARTQRILAEGGVLEVVRVPLGQVPDKELGALLSQTAAPRPSRTEGRGVVLRRLGPATSESG